MYICYEHSMYVSHIRIMGMVHIYNISIVDIEHSPYYIALGSAQNPQSDLVTINSYNIYIYTTPVKIIEFIQI